MNLPQYLFNKLDKDEVIANQRKAFKELEKSFNQMQKEYIYMKGLLQELFDNAWCDDPVNVDEDTWIDFSINSESKYFNDMLELVKANNSEYVKKITDSTKSDKLL